MKNFVNLNENILELNFKQYLGMDLIICEDYTLQFLEPIKKNSVSGIFSKIFSILKDDGILILELTNMENQKKNILKNDGVFKTWIKLDKQDPFAYIIQDMKFDLNKNIIINRRFIHKSIPLSKNSSETKYILKPYSKKEITKILKNSGFKNIKFFENFSKNSFQCQPFGCYVVVAQKYKLK